MTDPATSSDVQPTPRPSDEIGVLDMLIVFAKHKKLILGLPFATALLAIAYTLTMSPIYTGITRILPPQQSQSASSAMLAQLGGLASLVGATAGKGPSELYIAMLKSRTVAENVIRRFDLVKLWRMDVTHPSDAINRLAQVTTITAGKEGMITIEVDAKDPKSAAELANAYVDELYKLTSVLALTEASQRRLFFERQFALAKENLANAEAGARQALQTGGLVKVDEQGRAMVETTARLRGQITVKEVQIGAMRTFAAEGNPGLQLAQKELESMKRELARMEGADGAKSSAIAPSGQGADSLRRLRDVKYHEVIFELLARQYEMAKIDEAKDSGIIQVVDKAIEPDRKSKPNRALIVLIWTLLAGFVGILLAFVSEGLAKANSDPAQAQRLKSLKHYASWRRIT